MQMITFIKTNDFLEAKSEAPWAGRLYQVKNGYLAFRYASDCDVWLKVKDREITSSVTADMANELIRENCI